METSTGDVRIDLRDGWVPGFLNWESGKPVVALSRIGRRRPRSPFLAQDLTENLPLVHVPLEELGIDDERAADVPAGFIFHMSHCGSTLVAQMLGALDEHVVLGEPMVLNQALLALENATPETRIRYLRRLMAVFCRALRPNGERLLVKWTSWTVLHLPLIAQAFPGVPCCFIFRNPVEVMAAIFSQPCSWMRWHPIGGTLPPIELLEQKEVNDVTYAAHCLGSFCAVAASHVGRMLAIAYAELPTAVWTELAPFFGLQLSEERIARMEAVARIDAKDPTHSRVFVPDSARKQARASPEMRDAAVRLALPAIAALRCRHPTNCSSRGSGTEWQDRR